MSTTRINLRPAPGRRSATVLTAAVVLVAVGVTALSLALGGSTHRNPVTTDHHAATPAPVVAHHGTDGQPATLTPDSGKMHGGAVLDLETGQMHGGAVPFPASVSGTRPTIPESPLPHRSHWAGP